MLFFEIKHSPIPVSLKRAKTSGHGKRPKDIRSANAYFDIPILMI